MLPEIGAVWIVNGPRTERRVRGLMGVLDAMRELGDPNQASLFGDTPTPEKIDLLRNANERRNPPASAPSQGGLFAF